MGVKFHPFAQNVPGSDGSFSDTFQRANVGEGAGPNWAVNRRQSTTNVSTFALNTNVLLWQSQVGTVAACENLMWALPGQAVFGGGAAGAASLQAGSHFSEVTISADNSVGGSLTRVGPACSINGLISTVYGVYWIQNLPELLSFNLTRTVTLVDTNLIDHSATPMYATVAGLVLKLSWQVLDAATVRLRTYVNGTLIDTFDDTNAARVTNGGPGLYGQFASVGPTRFCKYSKYRCGPGI